VSLDNPQLIQKSQIKQAALVLSKAFKEDPITCWWIPNPEKRIEKMRIIWEIALKMIYYNGIIYTTSDKLEGVAGWMPPGKEFPSFLRMIWYGAIKIPFIVGLTCVRKMIKYQEFVEYIHKKYIKKPHWYFGPIGVSPEFQRQGFASKLLKFKFKEIDREKKQIYLETNTKKNVKMYERFGFEVVDESFIPGTDILNWGMLRNPQ